MLIINGQDNKEPFTVAVVVSRFNQPVTEALYKGAIQRLEEFGFAEHQITVAWVPGVVEIPVVAQRLARTGRFEAIITLGVVIRGETTHYDYVCQQVSDGCQQVALEHDLPVIFGVLTTENAEQAYARAGGDRGNKGADAVDAALEMVAVLRTIEF